MGQEQYKTMAKKNQVVITSRVVEKKGKSCVITENGIITAK
jgi:hypothetical protein